MYKSADYRRTGKTASSWGALLAASCLMALAAGTPAWAEPDSAGELNAAVSPVPAVNLRAIQANAAPVPLPPLPTDVPEAVSPDPAGLVGLYPTQAAELGIGHLRPKDLSSLQDSNWPNSPLLNANWLRGVALPLYAQPGGEPWGWFVNGWLMVDQNPPLAVGRDATFTMLHTYYGLYTFPVMEIRQDGWFRIQYTPLGSAWAHVSHLNAGTTELALETWEERFLAAGSIEFRSHGVSQALMPQPGGVSTLQALIGPNSLIQPLEFEGDWVRVRVTQPVDACSPLPGADTKEGWVRWRSRDLNSLVWFPPEGC